MFVSCNVHIANIDKLPHKQLIKFNMQRMYNKGKQLDDIDFNNTTVKYIKLIMYEYTQNDLLTMLPAWSKMMSF